MPVATRLTPDEIAEKLATHADMMWMIANNLHARNRSLSLEDIHAHVRLGFVLAASKFDPSRGLKFSTYAYRTGWGEAMNFCRLERARGFRYSARHPSIG